MQDTVLRETLQAVPTAWGLGTTKVYGGCTDRDTPILFVVLKVSKK